MSLLYYIHSNACSMFKYSLDYTVSHPLTTKVKILLNYLSLIFVCIYVVSIFILQHKQSGCLWYTYDRQIYWGLRVIIMEKSILLLFLTHLIQATKKHSSWFKFKLINSNSYVYNYINYIIIVCIHSLFYFGPFILNHTDNEIKCIER